MFVETVSLRDLAKCPNREHFHQFLTVTVCDHLAVLDIYNSQSAPPPSRHHHHHHRYHHPAKVSHSSLLSAPLFLLPSHLPPSPGLTYCPSSLYHRETRLTDPSSRHSLSQFNTREKQGSTEQTNRSLSCSRHSLSVRLSFFFFLLLFTLVLLFFPVLCLR